MAERGTLKAETTVIWYP